MELFYQRDIYGKTLVELGKQNKDIVVLDADLSGSRLGPAFLPKSFLRDFLILELPNKI
jgi:transketolase C-terminal domain/subunit